MTSIGAASGASNTVQCPGQGTNELATLGFFWEALRYNLPEYPVCTEQCPVSQQSNGYLHATVDCKSEQWAVRSQSSNVRTIGHVRCATGLSGAARRQRTSTVNRSKPQRATNVARTEHWTVPCLVRHRTVWCAIDNNG
jgi:hypothetical protein